VAVLATGACVFAGTVEIAYDSGTLGRVFTADGPAYDMYFAVKFYNDSPTPMAVKTVKIAGGDPALAGGLDVCIWYQGWDGKPESFPAVVLPDRTLDPTLAWNTYSVWDQANQAIALPGESIFAGLGLLEPAPAGVPYDNQGAGAGRSWWYDPFWWEWDRGGPPEVGQANLMVRIEVTYTNVWKGQPGSWFEPTKWWYGVPQANQQITIEGAPAQIGSGQASAGEIYLTGRIDQTDGTLSVTEALHIGYWYHEGTYHIAGGVLDVGELRLGPQGTGSLIITDPAAEVRVRQRLHLGMGARLVTDAATIHMTGADLAIVSLNPPDLADLVNVTFIFEGGAEAVDMVEVAGADRGLDTEGWTTNFALGTLQLGGGAPGTIRLVNEVDNQPNISAPDALYVHNITLNRGAAIELSGLKLYYLNGGDPKQFYVGDANLDGKVGIADLGALADNYGATQAATWARGDFNGDGRVGVADLGALADNYGAGRASATVPEPTALSLLLAAVTCLLSYQQPNRRPLRTARRRPQAGSPRFLTR